MSYLILIAAVLLALVAFAAVRRHPWLWPVAMAASETAGWFIGASALGWFAAGGDGWVNAASRVLFGGAALAFVVALGRGYRAGRAVTAAGARVTGESRPKWSRLGGALLPIARLPRRVTVRRDLVYGPHVRHRLDRIGPDPTTGPRPTLVHVHGGGWWRGKRHTQAHPLLYRLAASGWQVITPSYRFSPEATFPDHLVDVKRAIAWVRANATELGVDPGFIAIAGGSTGGNLAALVGLTMGDAALQPGFESADTSVQVCVPLYGVHDMLDDRGRPLWPYLETSVIKASPQDELEHWHRSSPVHLVTDRRPPFLVIHGANDTLVGPLLSRRLVDGLRSAGGPMAELIEVPWANHGFDFFAGPRGRATAAAVAAVLEYVHDEYRESVR
jgi:acetyl esterase/lipase